ncbi:MAG: PD-(D/E)XK nuclease family protein [Ktedonobacteraceae bacterium]|nr:PD-(D/E)XK nuclease family protein [Ktedonobacteraceae bacterium]
MFDNETAARVLRETPLSVSQLRAYTKCPKSYELQYLTDPRYRSHGMGASVWFGALMQKIIQHTYYDLPLYEAHIQVWQQECPQVFDALEEWNHLDIAYRESGNANTNARRDWLKEHSEYLILGEQIAIYQRQALGEWDWKKSYSLTGFYRWSSAFARKVPQEQVLLPHAVMVEGLPLYGPDGELMPLADDGSGRKSYRVLHGVFGIQSEVHVIGVPDEFGIDENGVAWICDNKVSNAMLTPEQLEEDAQLASYYLLLRQNEWIEPGQPTMVGHKYIQDGNVVPVWASISRYDDWVLPQLHEQFSALRMARLSGTFPRVRGIQPWAFSPCKYCGVAYACLEHLATERKMVSQEDELVIADF